MTLAPLVLLAALALLGACSGDSAPATVADSTPTPGSASPPAGIAVASKTIAVLPFADLSELGDQEYFSDGLSETLIDALSMMEDLQVATRDASFHYKGRDVVLNEVGAELGVAHILQGSVRKSGERLRVSAQLVDATNGFNLWSQTFDRELADTFTIQDEITDAVTTQLSVTLGAGRFDIPGMTRDVAAYDKALQAVATYNQYTPDAVFRALNMADEAVRIDPDYGRAWLLLGMIYTDSYLILSADQSAEFPALAARAFAQARQVAPDLPDLMLVEAQAARAAGHFQQAEQIYLAYFAKYRNTSARALDEYGQLLSATGRVEEAVSWLERARQLEPFQPRNSYQLALHLLYADRSAEALAEAEYGKTLDGSQFMFHSIGWQAALKQGDTAYAAELIGAYYAQYGDSSDDTVSRRFMEELSAILQANDFEASADAVAKLIQRPGATPVELAYVARLAAQLGQPEVALDYWFGEDPGPALWDSFYAEMRQLPDFIDLLREKGLVDYWQASGNWGDFCQPAGAGVTCQ